MLGHTLSLALTILFVVSLPLGAVLVGARVMRGRRK